MLPQVASWRALLFRNMFSSESSCSATTLDLHLLIFWLPALMGPWRQAMWPPRGAAGSLNWLPVAFLPPDLSTRFAIQMPQWRLSRLQTRANWLSSLLTMGLLRPLTRRQLHRHPVAAAVEVEAPREAQWLGFQLFQGR